MKVSYRRVQLWLMLFCIITAVVGLFVFVESSRAEGEAVESNVELQDGGMEMQLINIPGQNVLNPNCFDNYESWPSSSNAKTDSTWNLDFLVPQAVNIEFNQFLDVNGDGLLDYVYSYANNASLKGTTLAYIEKDGVVTDDDIRRSKTCIYLNNGSGWEKAYRCLVQTKLVRSVSTSPYVTRYYEPVFYGDCADVS